MNKCSTAAIIIILCFIVCVLLIGMLSCFMSSGIKTNDCYECSFNGERLTLDEHEVTFVVTDTWKCPYVNMHIDVTIDNKTVCNTTGRDGSCTFKLNGTTKCVLKIYDEDVKNEFELYPLKSCYLLVV